MKPKVAGGELKRHILSLITARGWRRGLRDPGFQVHTCSRIQVPGLFEHEHLNI
jgi:hypothetical protein